MCRCACARKASRTGRFWRRRREGIRWETARTALAVDWIPGLRSLAEFSKRRDRFANHLHVGIFGQRADLIAGCRVADIADHPDYSSAHLWIRAAEVAVDFIELSVELAELVKIHLGLL